MAKEWAKGFYASSNWKKTREAYMTSQHYICERCGSRAEIVHHKEYITRRNINDVNITLNWDNLEAVCRCCHAEEHEGVQATVKGLMFDENGNLVSGD